MPRYVVTGGAGFIGSNLSIRLVRDGADVIVVDNLSTGHLDNLSTVRRQLTFIKEDVRDISALRRLFRGADVVFHQAALPSVPRSIADPIASNANNIDGTLNVLVAARDSGVRRVVVAASSSAYGDTEVLPKEESLTPKPLSPYAVTKYVGELYCSVFTRVFGLETVALRYFNVFGPRQDPNSQYAAVIPRFILALLRGEAPVIFGDGQQSRDFTYVDNVVDANLLAAHAPQASGEVFNIGCGTRFTLNQLIASLNSIIGTGIHPRYTDPRPGDVRDSLASIDKARRVLGYVPKIPFEDGLRKTVEWFRRRTGRSD